MHKVVKNDSMRKMVSKSMLHLHILVWFFMVSNASMYFSFSSSSMPFCLAKTLMEVDMTKSQNTRSCEHTWEEENTTREKTSTTSKFRGKLRLSSDITQTFKKLVHLECMWGLLVGYLNFLISKIVCHHFWHRLINTHN